MKTSNKIFTVIVAVVITIGLMFLTAELQAQVKPSDKVLKDTVIKAVSYKLYVGSKGGRYFLKTSKSGKVYKSYIKAGKPTRKYLTK